MCRNSITQLKLKEKNFPSGDKIWRTSGWAAEGWAADGGGEAEEADAEEESRVRLPDPPGEDGTAAPGSPGNPCKMHPAAHSASLYGKKHTLFLFLQRIRDLEDKTEIQRRQIKDLEEKVGVSR